MDRMIYFIWAMLSASAFLFITHTCNQSFAEPGDHAEGVQTPSPKPVGPYKALPNLHKPDPKFTIGILCTKKDPNFKDLEYPEKVARCNRVVPVSEKLKIAKEYGNIPRKEWPKYEFDHLIPLCAGGSDDIRNLWPQPIAEAHEKDKVEDEVCRALKAGTIKQWQAVKRLHDWFLGGQ